MRSSLMIWAVLGLLLSTVVYAIAEEVTLTTLYPSPRGVYQALRVGSGSTSTPGAHLHVVQTDDNLLTLRIDDQPGDPTPLTIDQAGRIGLGTIPLDPRVYLTITGDPQLGNAVLVGGSQLRGIYGPGVVNSLIEVHGNEAAALMIWGGPDDVALLSNSSTRKQTILASNRVRKTTGADTGFPLIFMVDDELARITPQGDFRIRRFDLGNIPNPPDPQSPAPNGRHENLEVNDVYLRSTSQWLSRSTGGGIQSGFVAVATRTSTDPRDIPASLLGGSGSPAISFNPAFSNPPHVTVTPNFQFYTGDESMSVWVSPATTTGARINWHGPGSGQEIHGCQSSDGSLGASCGFHWVAYDGNGPVQ